MQLYKYATILNIDGIHKKKKVVIKLPLRYVK